MQRKILKLFAAFVLAGVGLVFGLIVLEGSRTPLPLPNPNGYDDFVNAGQLVTGNAAGLKTLTKDQLAAVVSANQDALKLVRAGLSRKCQVSLVNLTKATTNLGPALVPFRSLAMTLCAEGVLAEREGRIDDAARIYLEGIRFAQESCRGGLIVHRMVGVACEEAAAYLLQPLRNSLDAQHCREVAQALESIDSQTEPFAETIRQDNAWSLRTRGLSGQIGRLFRFRMIKKSRDITEAKVESLALFRRKMMISFSARAYLLDKGKSPQNIAELVPAYLKAVPKDPVTGADLSLVR